MTQEFLEKLMEFIDETVDRAIFEHENSNAHTFNDYCPTIHKSVLLEDLRGELLELTMEE